MKNSLSPGWKDIISNGLFTGNWRRNWVYNSADQRNQGILNLFCEQKDKMLVLLAWLEEILWSFMKPLKQYFLAPLISSLSSELSGFKMSQTFNLSKQRIYLRDYDYDLKNENHGQLIHHYWGNSSPQCLAKPSLISWFHSFPLVLPLWQCKVFCTFQLQSGLPQFPSCQLDIPPEHVYLVPWQFFSLFPFLTSCVQFAHLFG